MNRRNVLLAAAGVLVAVLIFGSVQTTGAQWRDQMDMGSGTTVHTGSLSLRVGSGSGSSFNFEALSGENLAPGDARQAELEITNTGTPPLEFTLATAGPTVEESGVVTVRLSGARGSCPAAATTDLSGAFKAANTSVATQTFVPPPPAPPLQRLEPAESTTWCIRAKLVSITGAPSATFRITFNFAAEQVRP
ncbi:hypothetical protein L5G32_14130 [Gordonia sp. HY002]|uniref:hypothetical protein n=1 Tax=Gordonia zhenghanii TaxID=2911516 RepID=UPI001EF0F2DD|nr:hypothetical protein [Gordonia zhenghanii]MCF8571406.1 hypothetical protein [Gordonia zhenghanii]MCF8606748.1 hypothetical protein [Gordonia zhenghanii]